MTINGTPVDRALDTFARRHDQLVAEARARRFWNAYITVVMWGVVAGVSIGALLIVYGLF